MPTADRERARPAFVAEIDADELACRIAEAACGIRRPPGMTAKQALDNMSRLTRRMGETDTVPGFRRAAQAAAEYLTECINNGRRPS
ncbi:hypothetical protein [Methylorubrum sp. SB2]|uniref:hypothetical protein n=1 Tax=Methylorubrum subtropicum TaxID=3138812 RepID=UPI00313BF465